jgi:hypothetical protein
MILTGIEHAGNPFHASLREYVRVGLLVSSCPRLVDQETNSGAGLIAMTTWDVSPFKLPKHKAQSHKETLACPHAHQSMEKLRNLLHPRLGVPGCRHIQLLPKDTSEVKIKRAGRSAIQQIDTRAPLHSVLIKSVSTLRSDAHSAFVLGVFYVMWYLLPASEPSPSSTMTTPAVNPTRYWDTRSLQLGKNNNSNNNHTVVCS